MGLRGPAPKPTALRIIEGNLGHRPLNQREPKPLVGEPDVPAHLSRDAKKEWRRLVPILLAMRGKSSWRFNTIFESATHAQQYPCD